MKRGVVAVAASILMAAASAFADDAAPFAFPNGWFSLNAQEAGLVFMIRAYGADVAFDVVDEAGNVVEDVAIPAGRTVVSQYRVPPGAYRVRFFDEEVEVTTRAGQFAAYGVAVTLVPASEGKAAGVWPSYAPFANYTPEAMEQRVTPLAALGTTDFLLPKPLDAKTLEFHMADERTSPR
jgi:hypothetical protein